MEVINRCDLNELESAVLTGVTVGVGSQVMIFGSGASLLVQCPFFLQSSGVEEWGHGEQPDTAKILVGLLNERIKRASLREGSNLILDFDGQRVLNIVTERNGFESYVLTTRLGICPVIVD